MQREAISGKLPVGLERGEETSYELVKTRVRPVLKHGPRSLTYARVFGCKTQGHREIEWSEYLHDQLLGCLLALI